VAVSLPLEGNLQTERNKLYMGTKEQVSVSLTSNFNMAYPAVLEDGASLLDCGIPDLPKIDTWKIKETGLS